MQTVPSFTDHKLALEFCAGQVATQILASGLGTCFDMGVSDEDAHRLTGVVLYGAKILREAYEEELAAHQEFRRMVEDQYPNYQAVCVKVHQLTADLAKQAGLMEMRERQLAEKDRQIDELWKTNDEQERVLDVQGQYIAEAKGEIDLLSKLNDNQAETIGQYQAKVKDLEEKLARAIEIRPSGDQVNELKKKLADCASAAGGAFHWVTKMGLPYKVEYPEPGRSRVLDAFRKIKEIAGE